MPLPYLKVQQLPTIQHLQVGKRILFLSDLHLGTPNSIKSTEREIKFCDFVRSEMYRTEAVVFLGDLFDCWMELPKMMHHDFPHIIQLFSDLKQAGITTYFFTGNHEIFMRGYLKKEFNIQVIRGEATWQVGDTKLFLAHGHGLGPQEKFYRVFKNIIESDTLKFFFDLLPPKLGLFLALKFAETRGVTSEYRPLEVKTVNLPLFNFCKVIDNEPTLQANYYIFGHVHKPEWQVTNNNRFYVNLGEWIHYFSYGILENGSLRLQQVGSDIVVGQ
jgi:UDP-2,3-diacylglucosamine hydrolase